MVTKFILQGVTTDSHLDEVRDALQLPDVERIVISVAFLNERGFSLLADCLEPVADKTTIFAGIRNGITSAQGLLACAECGCIAYAVDTGSRNVVFHPKIYLARSPIEARIVLGSANLTVGGLNGNIEAGLKIVADMTVKSEAELVEDLTARVDAIAGEFPQHVLHIKGKQEVLELLKAGRVIDEEKTRPPAQGKSSGNRDLDKIPKIELKKKSLKLAPVTPLTEKEEPEEDGAVSGEEVVATDVTKQEMPPALPKKPATGEYELVWVSNPLSRRPLNIPTAANTNPTGSMFFTKGRTEGIDQRHYFREDVFSGLAWSNDTAPGKEHLERATGKFRIVIKGANYGEFTMDLTHDSRTDSTTYLQKNSVTQLHWGDVKPMVASEDLLERTMNLYRDGDNPDQFILEID